MSHKVALLLGAVVGAALVLFVVSLTGERDLAAPAGAGPELEAKNQDLTRQVEDLSARVESLTAEVATLRGAPRPEDVAGPADPARPAEAVDAPPVTAAPEGPATKEEILAAVREFGGSFNQIMLGTGGDAVKRLRAVFERADEAQIAKLLEMYGETGDIGQKVVLAHALAQSGRDDALAGLTAIVRDQTRTFDDRRYIAHGLAFADNENLQPILLEVARSDPDRGTRANAAFGVARGGNDEGIALYASATDEAFRENDPIALQYLSGFAMLGKRAMPAVRARLDTYKETQTRLVLIELIRGEKDRESLPALHRLGSDPQADPAVQAAARKAAEEIESQE